MTTTTQTLPATPAPTAAAITAARAVMDGRVEQLRANGVEPRDIDPMAYVTANAAIAALLAGDQAAFADFDLTPAFFAAAVQVAQDLDTKLKSLPADFRRARRLPAETKTLQETAYKALGKYFSYVDRKARGVELREAARRLGVGSKRGRSVRALEQDFRDILNAAKDTALLAKFNVKPFQVTALKDMHQKLAAVLGGKDQIHAVAAADLLKVDKLQLWLETWFGDVGAAADWALDDEKRLQLVSLLPRTDVGRGKGKLAPAVAGNEGGGEAAS